jgi:hypothetical protein
MAYLTSKIMQGIQDKPGNRNFIIIYDRSGSMHHLLKSLGEDMIRLSKLLKKDDTLTLSWFSGEKQFRTILKGFQITGDNDFSKIEQAIRANLSSIGMTCFSEVINDTILTVEDLRAAFPDNSFVLSFFTDGYPVVRDVPTEERKVLRYLSELATVVGDSLFIGYGDYYNRELLSQMALAIGGTLVHAEAIDDYDKSMTIMIQHGKASRKIVIDFDEDVMLVFGKSGGKIAVYPCKDGKAIVPEFEREVFAVTKQKPKVSKESLDSMYAAAYAMSSQGQMDEALEWLGRIGDKHLIDKLYNAFTTAEMGEVTNAIQDAVFDESKRFIEGQKKGYVAKADAFCLLEALELLVQDKEAFFYPGHPKWDYKRIGAGRKQKEGFPIFTRASEAPCKFENLIMSSDRLNLSVLTKIEGHVELDEYATNVGLDKIFKCFQWKNYALVKDGNLNVLKLPCSMSRNSFMVLKAAGLIAKNTSYKEKETYVLDLKRIPIMNRVIADGNDSARTLANLAMEEVKYGAELKVLKYLLNEAAPSLAKETPFTQWLTVDQFNQLCKFKGFRPDGSFSPPTESVESTDHYFATTFELKVVGFSSLPSVKEVVNKNGKTTSGKVMLEFYNKYRVSGLKDEKYITSLQKRIEEAQKAQKAVRHKIQKAKFAVVLGRRWFKEFGNNREDCQIVCDEGVLVKFVLGKKKVEY